MLDTDLTFKTHGVIDGHGIPGTDINGDGGVDGAELAFLLAPGDVWL